MDNTTEHHSDLRVFEDVSLWQLIPAGGGHALSYLRKIVDYLLTQRPERMPTVCIYGSEGKRTHALAFLNSLAITTIKEIDGRAIQAYSGFQTSYEETTPDTGVIITHAHSMPSYSYYTLYQILRERRFAQYNINSKKSEYIAVHGMSIITATSPTDAMQVVLDQIDYAVQLEPYTDEQRKLIILQRIKYCGLNYEDERVLEMIVHEGNGILREMIQLLRACVVIVKSEGRETVHINDVKRACILCQIHRNPKAKM